MYDNVCKKLVEDFSSDFASWYLGKPEELTKLKPTELYAEPIRADALILLESSEIILHIEFQTQPDPTMALRMADYYVRVARRYPNKEMVQVVIYLKPTSSKLVQQNVYQTDKMRHEFDVIRLWEQPVSELIKYPGLLPLAALGKTDDREENLRQISLQIDKIEDRTAQSNIATTTSVLAGLVLNEQVIKSILRREIMQDSVIYQDIKREGKKEGQEELILRQLKRRTGQISETEETKINGLSQEKLEALGDALLDFKTKDDLTAWLANN